MQLSTLLSSGDDRLQSGPIALIFAEDDTEVLSTLTHHIDLGFKLIVLFADEHMVLEEDLPDTVVRVSLSFSHQSAVIDTINRINSRLADAWIYYCFNAEYMFYPFCETRSVGELTHFLGEERRAAMLSFVVDIYADDLGACPSAVSLERAHLDRTGYYALARKDQRTGHPKERQLDFHGGLRWRFEEHVPTPRRKIDRVAFFKSDPKITLRSDFTFSAEEMNTYACPWHHSLTGAICSFRTAKALKKNPGSTHAIQTFKWHNSTEFEWHSQQLMNLGLMEPGQWF
jgi:hypothetical protein